MRMRFARLELAGLDRPRRWKGVLFQRTTNVVEIDGCFDAYKRAPRCPSANTPPRFFNTTRAEGARRTFASPADRHRPLAAPSARAPGFLALPPLCIHARRARARGSGLTQQHSERQPAPAAVHHKNRTRSPVPVGRSLCRRTAFATARPLGSRSSIHCELHCALHTARKRPPEAHTAPAPGRGTCRPLTAGDALILR